MKRAFAILLCCVALFGLFGCGKAEETNYCRVNGATVNFMSASEREKLREPLEKLILEALALEPVTDDFYDYIKLFDADSPTVIPGIEYGLFDVNLDGVPELFVHPYGYTGSSGTATYSVFDIYRGENIGVIQSGQDDWCVYVESGTSKLVIMGEYITRGGWAGHSYACVMLGFASDAGVLTERCVLSSHNSYIGSDNSDVNDGWSAVYYVDEEKTGPEMYLHSSKLLKESYARIPEMKLVMVCDEHYYDLDISMEEHARYIVDLLLSTGQELFSK